MTNQVTDRRRFLGGLGAAGIGLLAGCSDRRVTGDGQDERLDVPVPSIEPDETEAASVGADVLVPRVLAEYSQFSGAFEGFFSLSAIDVGSMDLFVRGLGESLLVVRSGFDAERLTENLRSRGAKPAEPVGDYDVLAAEDSLLALTEDAFVVASPNPQLALSPRELLERLLAAERGETDSLREANEDVATILGGIDARHRLRFEVRFEGTYPSEGAVPGARGVALGGTLDDAESDPSYRREARALFPEGAVREAPFREWARRSLAVSGEAELAVERDGQLLRASGPAPISKTATPPGHPTPGPEDVQVKIRGRQFEWRFDYPRGEVADRTTLVLPVGKRAVLECTSEDVTHGFGVTPFRVNLDAIPDQTTYAAITPEETGSYTARCTELCGSGHSDMTAPVEVVPESEYRDWLRREN